MKSWSRSFLHCGADQVADLFANSSLMGLLITKLLKLEEQQLKVPRVARKAWPLMPHHGKVEKTFSCATGNQRNSEFLRGAPS